MIQRVLLFPGRLVNATEILLPVLLILTSSITTANK